MVPVTPSFLLTHPHFRICRWWSSCFQVDCPPESASKRIPVSSSRSLRTRLRDCRHTGIARCARICHCQSHRRRLCSQRRARSSEGGGITENRGRIRIQRYGRQRAEFPNLHFAHHTRRGGRSTWRTQKRWSAAVRQWCGKFDYFFSITFGQKISNVFRGVKKRME